MQLPPVAKPETNPMNTPYRDMTAAWRAGDYAEAWSRADVMMQAMAGGQPAPDDDPGCLVPEYPHYWISWIHRFYHPDGPVPRDGRPPFPHHTTARPVTT